MTTKKASLSKTATGLRRSARKGARRAGRSLHLGRGRKAGRYAAIAGGAAVLGGLGWLAYTVYNASPEKREQWMTTLRELKSLVPLGVLGIKNTADAVREAVH